MPITEIETKGGDNLSGAILEFRPEYGWFMIDDKGGRLVLYFAELRSAITRNVWGPRGTFDRDEIRRAAIERKVGREHGWRDYPTVVKQWECDALRDGV